VLLLRYGHLKRKGVIYMAQAAYRCLGAGL